VSVPASKPGRATAVALKSPEASTLPGTPARRRHKCFDDTHREIIETTVRLISEKGVDAVSIAAVARAMGINRATVYYHFDSLGALIGAVKAWSSEQLAKPFTNDAPQQERVDYITRFVLENPQLIKLWIEELISVGDIRTRYAHWDALVEGIRGHDVATDPGEAVDAEVFCVILLTSSIIGPRVFRNSVCPGADTETVVKRFRAEQLRMLRHTALLKL
jgi:AcrR family transcriptional regulator